MDFLFNCSTSFYNQPIINFLLPMFNISFFSFANPVPVNENFLCSYIRVCMSGISFSLCFLLSVYNKTPRCREVYLFKL